MATGRMPSGGDSLDPGGALYEGLIHTMQRNGRDPVEDLMILRPDSDYCVLESRRDPARSDFSSMPRGGVSRRPKSFWRQPLVSR